MDDTLIGGLSSLIGTVARAWCAATRVDDAPLLAVMPMWQGEPPPAQIIVTHKFAGNGDVLALCRYLPLLTGAGYRASFRCKRPGFRRLLEYSLNEPSASFRGGQELPWQIPLHYLPAMCTTGALIPRKVAAHESAINKPFGRYKPYIPARPYLHADPGRVAYYRRRIPEGAVGLCWASGYYDENRGSRKLRPLKTMALRDMEPIYHAHPCVNLQVGVDRAEIAGTPVIDVLPPNPDWAETAALVMALRCVVTIDTAVAHLAGGLGADVHLAFHGQRTPYWRINGIDSPWYRTVKIYQGHSWSAVTERITAALDC